MQDEMLRPLTDIRHTADALLETDLDDLQVNTIQTMSNSARELIELIVSFPEVEWDHGREVFSYDARSSLATLIGYTEMLLEGEDGPLTQAQRDNLGYIQAAAKHLLRLVTHVTE